MKATASKSKDCTKQQDDKILYIGTTEDVAKLAPSKGLEPPVFLTDIYAGFFCKSVCPPEAERWGIISVKLNTLYQDMIAPSPAFIQRINKLRTRNPAALEKQRKEILENLANYKNKWKLSLAQSGVCVYLLKIPPTAIEKIMIYNINGRDTNPVINDIIKDSASPYEQTAYSHKHSYHKGLAITRWFNGEAIRCHDIYNGQTTIKQYNEIDDKLNNRLGLDVYYIKTEEKYKHKVKKNGT